MNSDNNQTPEAGKDNKLKSSVTQLAWILLFGVSIAAIFFYNQVRTLEQGPDAANAANAAKVAALVEKVGALISLPEGETPVAVVVTDTAALANRPFFAKAKVGDEMLYYPLAQKAFLYNPTKNIIVEVASLSIGK